MLWNGDDGIPAVSRAWEHCCLWYGACSSMKGSKFWVEVTTHSGMARKPSGSGRIQKIRRAHPVLKFLVSGFLVLTAAFFSFFWTSYHPAGQKFPPSGIPAATFSWSLQWNDLDRPVPTGAYEDGPIYPYSVIPGGVASAKKLQSALRGDPVAAAHYRDFQIRGAHVIRLARERRVYISYRVADRIYWTRTRVTLHAGEALLSDGAHLVRTRCGNRISEVPAEPVAPADPPSEVLNTPVSPQLTAISPEPAPVAPLWAENSPPFPLVPGTPPPAPAGDGPFLPFIPIGPCCDGSSSSAPSGPLPQPGPLPPPVAASEPPAVVLVAIGLAGLLFLQKIRRSRPLPGH